MNTSCLDSWRGTRDSEKSLGWLVPEEEGTLICSRNSGCTLRVQPLQNSLLGASLEGWAPFPVIESAKTQSSDNARPFQRNPPHTSNLSLSHFTILANRQSSWCRENHTFQRSLGYEFIDIGTHGAVYRTRIVKDNNRLMSQPSAEIFKLGAPYR